jgi:glycosyltransferase involved in cell wall biosynthesis
MFPEADIFTHVISPEIREKYFSNRNVYTSFINNLPYAVKLYKNYMPLMFKAAKSFNLHDYDLIVSSESGPIKGIDKPATAKHICYCHSPMRYIWDMYDEYYQNAPLYKKCGMKLLKNYLRRQDECSAENVNIFIANSNFVKDRIKRIYKRSAEVVYPPVDIDNFQSNTDNRKDYYLMAGELINYKRPDIAVKAFNNNKRKLIIAGAGEELKKLKSLAKPNIAFTGRISDKKLNKLYCEAKALIFPGIEDFGMIPVEAQAVGTPVIAYQGGGALETVIDGKTGLFFKEQTPESLNTAIEIFEKTKETFIRSTIRLESQKFSSDNFRKSLMDIIHVLYGDRQDKPIAFQSNSDSI